MRKFIPLAALLILTGAGCAANVQTNGNATSSEHPVMPPTANAHSELALDAQKAGSAVTIKKAVFGKSGFIVVNQEENGQPGPVVAVSRLYASGMYTNIVIQTSIQAGTFYYVSIHADNGDGVFNASDDATVKDENGNLVMIRFQAEPTTPAGQATSSANLNVRANVTTKVVADSIANFAFSPAVITVNKGDKVTFTNHDSISHTVTADGGAFDSGMISSGQSYTLDTSALAAGTYAFHCAVHPTMMHGTLIVQ